MRLLAIFFVMPFLMTGQSKFFTNLNFDFSTPYTQSYFYNSETYAINNIELRDKNMVFNTYGLSFSANYSVFKKWSVGLTIGSYTDTEKHLTQVRAGVLTRFFPKDEYLFNPLCI